MLYAEDYALHTPWFSETCYQLLPESPLRNVDYDVTATGLFTSAQLPQMRRLKDKVLFKCLYVVCSSSNRTALRLARYKLQVKRYRSRFVVI